MLVITETWKYTCDCCGETGVAEADYSSEMLRVSLGLPPGWLQVRSNRVLSSYFCSEECLRECLDKGPKGQLVLPL